jgi:hypothetical protein
MCKVQAQAFKQQTTKTDRLLHWATAPQPKPIDNRLQVFNCFQPALHFLCGLVPLVAGRLYDSGVNDSGRIHT